MIIFYTNIKFKWCEYIVGSLDRKWEGKSDMKGVVMKNVLAVIGLPLLVGFTLRAGILTHEFKVEEFGNF